MAESSIDEQATIEAARIEFSPAIKDGDRSQIFSSVTLEAAGIHDLIKVSVAAEYEVDHLASIPKLKIKRGEHACVYG